MHLCCTHYPVLNDEQQETASEIVKKKNIDEFQPLSRETLKIKLDGHNTGKCGVTNCNKKDTLCNFMQLGIARMRYDVINLKRINEVIETLVGK